MESNPEPFLFYSNPIFKQWVSRIRQIRLEYSIIVLIRLAHCALNIQCRFGQVRLIGIEYSVDILIRWSHSDSIFNAGPDRLG